MSQDFHLNPFDNITHFCRVLKLPESRFAQGWRLTECLLGEINGIPGSRGLLVATDGMTCVVFRTEQSSFQGHMEWFVADNDQTEVEEEVNKAIFKNKSVSQQCRELDELF
jgi:hypothetical protein